MSLTEQQREEVRQIIREEKRLRGKPSGLSDRFEPEIRAALQSDEVLAPQPPAQSGGTDGLHR